MRGGVDHKRAAQFVEALRRDQEGLIEAAVADGWPREMAKAGFENHWQTWNVEALAESVRLELALVDQSPGLHWIPPKKVHHIWPALPGAGLTPVLVGMLLGVAQAVRPSRRGLAVARRIAEHGQWELMEPDGPWHEADVVVVSGSDETLREVHEQMAGRGRVVGYGHRVSFGVVVDGDSVDLEGAARRLAADVVMWHQRGCFSVRGVLFCGVRERRRRFCEELAGAIAEREERWNAKHPGDTELAARAQALGLAQMKGPVFGSGVGYVTMSDEPFRGKREAIHSVTVHVVDGPEGLGEAVDLPVSAVQGVAMAGDWRSARDEWLDALVRLGATRVAPAGTMQAPPADWWHDGRPNALGWGRVVRVG